MAYNQDHHYISNGKLDEILTLETVQDILPACLELDWENQNWQQDVNLYAIASEICGTPVSYKKTLAILILCKMHQQLPNFLDCKLDDSSLPVYNRAKDATCRLRVKKSDGNFEPLSCFEGPDWDYDKLDSFYERQWKFLAPYFNRGTEGDEKLHHYKLLKRAPLPFKTIKASPDQGDNAAPGGHYGEVTFVEIDEAHHRLPSYSSTEKNAQCALKKLRPRVTRKDFDHEVDILKRLSTQRNQHLVKLLFTMELHHFEAEQRPEFYLVFPLASGDLNGLWAQRSPPSRGSEEMTDFAQWFLSQCQGITNALDMVHNMPRRKDSQRSTGVGQAKDPYYGIHADIKPANLLWFEDWKEATHKLGVIQIADFGISNFHTTDSRSNARLPAFTRTYRAPEIDLFQKISRSFDIWGLGCVFLEFVSWVVIGHPSGKFSESRMAQGLDRIPQDTFYQLYPDKDRTKAVVSPAVIKWVLELRRHHDCTQFVNNFLDLIVDGMLVVEDKPQRDSWRRDSRHSPSEPPIQEANSAPKDMPMTPGPSINSSSRQTTKSSAASGSIIGTESKKKRLTCQEIIKRLEQMSESGRANKEYYTKQELRLKPSEDFTRPQGIIVAQSMESLAEKQKLKW
ncbi:kinase-like domain-containing protein [Rhypophila decipiens]|uniref:Kinase-like domain-containing protein n=1 Tax=Rhypophila decipiens TaxID=261697 RepID=A0AAN6Y9L1_9PEZI|nr:kinase-like domain-containing protein [Rhypophila decipiens]